MIHRHHCINHTPDLVWVHDTETPCLEPAAALCDACYEEQASIDMAQRIYQAGTSYAGGCLD